MNLIRNLFVMTLFLVSHQALAQGTQGSEPNTAKGNPAVAQYKTTQVHTDTPGQTQVPHPFFTEDAAHELEEKYDQLEKRVKLLEAKTPVKTDGTLEIKTEGGVSIQNEGADLVLRAPNGKIRFEGKQIILPPGA